MVPLSKLPALFQNFSVYPQLTSVSSLPNVSSAPVTQFSQTELTRNQGTILPLEKLNEVWNVSDFSSRTFATSAVPTLSIPAFAEGGVVTSPTILEAGEAGSEAIIPLGDLWANLQDVVPSTITVNSSGGVAALAEQMGAVETGENVLSVTDLLGGLDSLSAESGTDEGGGESIQIIYSPTNHYHFEGDAPSKEEISGAEAMSQDEFNRRVDQYFKSRQRTHFRG